MIGRDVEERKGLEKSGEFVWNLEALEKNSYFVVLGTEKETEMRDEFFQEIEKKFKIKKGPLAPVLLQEGPDRYAFVAEDGIYVTDTLDSEKIALVAENYWKAQELLIAGGSSGYEGPYRRMGRRYDKTGKKKGVEGWEELDELDDEDEFDDFDSGGGPNPCDSWPWV